MSESENKWTKIVEESMLFSLELLNQWSVSLGLSAVAWRWFVLNKKRASIISVHTTTIY